MGYAKMCVWMDLCNIPDEATAGSGSSIIQILGIKGAKQETVRIESLHLIV